MRKVTLMILTAAMILSMTACGGEKETTESSAPATEAVTEAPTEAEEEEEEETDAPAAEEDDAPAAEGEGPAAEGEGPAAEGEGPAAEGEGPGENEEGADEGGAAVDGTLGQTLLADFTERAADEAATAQELADALMTNPAILFGPATMPVEPGMLTGFGNAEITGFKEGVMFAPMIGSIAFVGYVFDLEEGTDGAAFMQTLTDNADPRWNICVEAEETVCEQVGNKVFFVMCPKTLEG